MINIHIIKLNFVRMVTGGNDNSEPKGSVSQSLVDEF